jgi:hypothetical protein
MATEIARKSIHISATGGVEIRTTFETAGAAADEAGKKMVSAFQSASGAAGKFDVSQVEAGLKRIKDLTAEFQAINNRYDTTQINQNFDDRRARIIELETRGLIEKEAATRALAVAERERNAALSTAVTADIDPAAIRSFQERMAAQRALTEEGERYMAQLNPRIALEQELQRIESAGAAVGMNRVEIDQLRAQAIENHTGLQAREVANNERLENSLQQLNMKYTQGFALAQRQAQIHELAAAAKIDEATKTRFLAEAERELGAATGSFNTGNLRQGLQQLPLQLQDVIVSFQGGTDAAIIFGQQFPQMASAFGPWGAALGLAGAAAAVVAGSLYILSDNSEQAKDSTEALSSALDDLDSKLGIVDDSANSFIATLRGLTDAQSGLRLGIQNIEVMNIDEQLADLQKQQDDQIANLQTRFVAKAIGDARAQGETSPEQIAEATKRATAEFKGLVGQMQLGTKTAADLTEAVTGLGNTQGMGGRQALKEAEELLLREQQITELQDQRRRNDIELKMQQNKPLSSADLEFYNREKIQQEALREGENVTHEQRIAHLDMVVAKAQQLYNNEQITNRVRLQGLADIAAEEERIRKKQELSATAAKLGGTLEDAREAQSLLNKATQPLEKRAQLEKEIADLQNLQNKGVGDSAVVNKRVADLRREIAEIDAKAATKASGEEDNARKRDQKIMEDLQGDLERRKTLGRTATGDTIEFDPAKMSVFQAAAQLQIEAMGNVGDSVDKMVARQDYVDKWVDKFSKFVDPKQIPLIKQLATELFNLTEVQDNVKPIADLSIANTRAYDDQLRLTKALNQGTEAYQNEQAVLRTEAQLRAKGIEDLDAEAQAWVANQARLITHTQALADGMKTKQQYTDASVVLTEQLEALRKQYDLGAISATELARAEEDARLAAKRRELDQGAAGRLNRDRQWDQLDVEGFRASQDPIDGVRAAMHALRAEIPTTAEYISENLVGAWGEASSALGDFVVGGVYDLETMQAALKSVTDSIQKMVLQFFLNKALMAGLNLGLGAPGPQAGQDPSNVHTTGAIYHQGGEVGLPTSWRTGIDPRVFNFANRYHRGGLAGDEVPAILQRGEMVIPRGAMGSAPPEVQVFTSPEIPVRTERSRGSNDRYRVRVFIGKQWEEHAADGGVSKTMRARFNVRDRLM